MSARNRNSSNKKETAGERTRPQGGPPPAVSLSRQVIRDKTNPNLLIELPEGLTFPDQESEKAHITSYGRRGYGVVFEPIPYVFGNPEAAHVDWLAFTFNPNVGDSPYGAMKLVTTLLGLRMSEANKHGWNGYKCSVRLGDYGFIAWGGEHQRGTIHVEINGTGCMAIADLTPLVRWATTVNARITRVDLAHDDFLGEVCNIAQIFGWHGSKGFHCGGRPPKLKRVGDWDQLTDGRTLTVGTRGNKFLRCYEKGKQLGRIDSEWFRVELELKNKNRHIPWDVLERPGQYLAGAYPCLSFLTETQCKTKTNQLGSSLTLEAVAKHARRLSGKAINVLMDAYGDDAEAVVKRLRRSGIPKRLKPFASPPVFPAGTGENA